MADENQTPEEKLADLYARVGRIQIQDSAAAKSAATALDAAGLSADAATYAVNASVTAQKYAAQMNKGSLSNPSKPNGYKVEIIGDTGKELKVTRQDGSGVGDVYFKEDGNILVGKESGSAGRVDMWKAITMHGTNVNHGTGASTFANNDDYFEMSVRGFYGGIKDSSTGIVEKSVELDIDDTNNAVLKLNGKRVLTEDDLIALSQNLG